MRKLLTYLFVFVVLLGAFGLSTKVGLAQDIGIDPAILEDPDVFTFKELGYTERYMVGPYDNQFLTFSIPTHWKLTAGTYIELEFSYAFGGSRDVDPEQLLKAVGGSLIVRYNNELLNTVLLTNPEGSTIKINVPLDAFVTDAEDGRHSISLFLDASLHCDEEFLDTVLWIEPDSYIKFVYDEVSPVNDLTKFPRPFYLPNALVPAEATVVIPDNPTAAELEAGMSVVGGLGSITNGQSIVTLKQLGAVSEELRGSQHLLFVGTADKFPELHGLGFPVTITGGTHNLPAEVANDGVIQLLSSPWNPIKSILLISGNSQESVELAARAVSSGKLVTSGLPNVSLVSSVSSADIEEVSIVDQSLSDMGFETSTLGVYGDVYYELTFYATAEQARSVGSYLDLVLTRSNLLNFNQSGAMILLNDEVVGTIGFEEGDSEVISQRFELLPNFVQRGENRLDIATTLIPYDLCYTAELEATWVTISDTSSLHLPISEQQIVIGERLDFTLYPLMFQGDAQLSDLAFVLPKGNQAAIETAAQIAFYLGNQETINFANFSVFFADEVSEDQLVEKDLIFVGRASEFPQISEINDQLPAKFDAGGDSVSVPILPVNYSVLPEVGVGYAQLLDSPWNSEKALMLVMGNMDSGLLMTKNALTENVLVGDLAGNFASIYDRQVLAVDTRMVNREVEIISDDSDMGGDDGEDQPTTTQPPATPGLVEARPGWLVPAILATSALMLLFIIIAAVRSRKR